MAIPPLCPCALGRVRASRRSWLAATAVPVLCALAAPPLGAPWVSVALAADDERPALGVFHFVKRGDVGNLALLRLEEYLRQMLDAGGAVRILPAKVIETGKPLTAPAAAAVQRDKPLSPQAKAIDKADKLVAAAREVIAEGEALADAAKMLGAAAQRYEQNFVELADFSKLVDCYALIAQVALALDDDKSAADNVGHALAIQPSFVVDGRKQNKDLKALVDKIRDQLDAKPKTDITVDSSQPDAEVFVDGVKIGAAPATAKGLYQGAHYVQVRKAGATPWGQALVAKGKPLATRAILQMEVAPENEIAVAVSSDDLKEFVHKGAFHDKVFKNSAALFARQVGATHLLFGVVNKRPTVLELHLFLYGAKARKTCAIDKIEYAPNLTNLQMPTLDAEGRVRTALLGCSSEVTATPAVFGSGPAPSDEPAPPDIVPTPPDPEPRVDPKPDPRPEPRVDPKPDPKPDPRANPRSDPIDPYAGLIKPEDPSNKPFYQTWWFWTALGVAAIGGTVGGIAAGQSGGTPITGYSAKVVLP